MTRSALIAKTFFWAKVFSTMRTKNLLDKTTLRYHAIAPRPWAAGLGCAGRGR